MAMVMTFVACLVFYAFRNFLFQKFSFPPVFIWVIPVIAFMTFSYEFVLLVFRNRNDANRYMKINMFRISTELGLAVILIVALAWGWWGRVASILVALVCVAFYSIYFLKKNNILSGRVQKEIVFAELKYSVPVILMQLSMFCLFSSDSFLLAGITKNNAEVGIYGMACVFGSIIITLSGALIQYMIPKINLALSAKTVDYADIRKQFSVYAGIMAFAFLALLFVVPIVYHVFINASYWPGIRYYYFLSAGYFFWTITTFLYSFLLYYKQKKKLFMLASLSIIISLCSNYIFIKSSGAFGAAISVCCSYFLVLLLALFFTKNFWRKIFIRL
jgi:O-antigen/teichoic acid export membrane protein